MEARSARWGRDKSDAQAVSSPQLSGADLLARGTLTATIIPLAQGDHQMANTTQHLYLG